MFFFVLQRIRELEDRIDLQKRQIKEIEEKVQIQKWIIFEKTSVILLKV